MYSYIYNNLTYRSQMTESVEEKKARLKRVQNTLFFFSFFLSSLFFNVSLSLRAVKFVSNKFSTFSLFNYIYLSIFIYYCYYFYYFYYYPFFNCLCLFLSFIRVSFNKSIDIIVIVFISFFYFLFQ